MEINGITEYLKYISKIPILSREEEAALVKKMKEGDEYARERLVESCLALVVSIAKSYAAALSYDRDHLFQEYIQEGNIRLLKALDKYDLSRGTRIGTYATYWIHKMIRSFQVNNSIIHCPANKRGLVNKIEAYEDTHLKSTGEIPTITQIADALNLSEEDVEVASMLVFTPLSLEQAMENDGEKGYRGIKDIPDPAMEEALDTALLKQDILDWMSRELTEDEADIMQKTIDLDGEGKRTLQELGDERGRCYETARRTRNRAREKLLNSEEADLFRALLGKEDMNEYVL